MPPYGAGPRFLDLMQSKCEDLRGGLQLRIISLWFQSHPFVAQFLSSMFKIHIGGPHWEDNRKRSSCANSASSGHASVRSSTHYYW